MPYVGFQTSLELSAAQKDTIKKIIGEMIVLIPGKSVEVTMFNIKGGACLKKGESDAECAFIEVRMRGTATNEAKDAFVAQISKRLKAEFGLEAPYIYINFLEFETWGSNGNLH